MFQSFVFKVFFRCHLVPSLIVNAYLLAMLKGRQPKINLYNLFVNALWTLFSFQYFYSALEARSLLTKDFARMQQYSQENNKEQTQNPYVWYGIYGLLLGATCCAYIYARKYYADKNWVLIFVQALLFLLIYQSVVDNEFYFLILLNIPVSFIAILFLALQSILRSRKGDKGGGDSSNSSS